MSKGHRSLSYFWRSYLRVAETFRNGPQLAWCHYWRAECAGAVFWNGREFHMPQNSGGLCDTVVEIWGLQPYTANGFYRVRDGDVVIDLGANVGAFSLWAARQAPGATIIAVEPSPKNAAMLRRNIAGWHHQISVCEVAIGEERGVGALIETGRSVDHRVTPAHGPAAGQSATIKVVPFDDILQMAPKRQIDFLKVDIEGAERDLFAAMNADTLGRLRRIGLEYHDNLTPGTLASLRERLAATHRILSCDGAADGYGIIQAVLLSDVSAGDTTTGRS